MDITYYKKPWRHAVIDNFFSEDLLNHISTLEKPDVTKRVQRFKDELVSEYFQTALEQQGKNHYLEFNHMQAGTEHPVHDEAPSKKLSVVVYISPEISDGTYVYTGSHKLSFVKEIAWKVNRAFIFKGIRGVTWHSFANKQDLPRLTINYFATE